jgi:hypothetical protein
MTPSPLTPEPSEKPTAYTWADGTAVCHSERVPWQSEPEPPLVSGQVMPCAVARVVPPGYQ